MIDSHCHLDHDPLFENLSEILHKDQKTSVLKDFNYKYISKKFSKILFILLIKMKLFMEHLEYILTSLLRI